MRLKALAILALTSSSCAKALRPRIPSAPPYPISSTTPNVTAYGVTGSSSTPSSSSHVSTGYSSSSSASPYVSAGSSISSKATYYPTGSSPSSSSVSKPAGNSTAQQRGKCSGETLNVLGASLDWWYTRTLYNVVSTISLQFNRNDSTTGWTALPATTPFDLASAMASPTCTTSYTFNTYWNISLPDVSCTPAPTPVAASTTVITQTAYKQLNATTGVGRIPDVVKTPPPATITIPSSGGTYAQGTAFVYFSAYEIVTKSPSSYGNGSVGCAEATQTYNMAEPFSFEYADGDVNGTQEVGAGVTGDVNPAFLQVVSASKAVAAGSWVAAPTVAVVVQDIYAAEAVLAAAAGPLRTTQTILQTPEPTLPPGFSTGPPETALPPPGNTGHIESTARSLDVPTPVNQKTTEPGNPKPTKPGNPNTKPPGGLPTKPNGSPHPGGHTSQGNSPHPGSGPRPTISPGAIGPLISAILSVATPTNALEVLQQATATFATLTNPTAEAIVNGLTPGSKNGIRTGPDGKPTLVVGGTTITADSHTEFHVGGATLTPGGTVVVHGTSVSLASGLTAVVVNGQTHQASQAAITPAPVLTIGGTTFAPSNGPTYVIGTQSLTPGGVITVQGTTISLGPGGSSIVVNGLTQQLGSASPASITAPPVLTIGGETFTAINGGPTYVIDGETLTPGGIETVEINGKTYIVSLGPGATVLVIETEGPNGDVTATSYETLYTGSGSPATVTNTDLIGASTGAKPSSGPSHTVGPILQNSAQPFRLQINAVYISLAAIAVAIWL